MEPNSLWAFLFVKEQGSSGKAGSLCLSGAMFWGGVAANRDTHDVMLACLACARSSGGGARYGFLGWDFGEALGLAFVL